jgi:hypothetical protein
VNTDELCLGETCNHARTIRGGIGSSQSAAAAGAGPATETAPSGSSTPVATEDADTATPTPPSNEVEEAAGARGDMGDTRAPVVPAQEEEVGDRAVELRSPRTSQRTKSVSSCAPQSACALPPKSVHHKNDGILTALCIDSEFLQQL